MDIEKQRIAVLERENQRLRDDNEKLIRIVAQMKITMNRLLDRCLANGEES